ncbi:MAG TPA: AsmA family protein, partial [Sulfuricaulis sp.]|nr:AsmA family protein [Sulfuricaulis sp.]
MSKPLKIILLAVGGLVVFLVLVAVALHLSVDANAFKPRLEAAASGVLGMEVRVGGRVGIGFFPGLHVTLQDVNIRNRGADLASAKQASLGIDLLPLLYQEVQIGKIALKQPRISIERDHDGKYNFEK